jgi:hypothetical protein
LDCTKQGFSFKKAFLYIIFINGIEEGFFIGVNLMVRKENKKMDEKKLVIEVGDSKLWDDRYMYDGVYDQNLGINHKAEEFVLILERLRSDLVDLCGVKVIIKLGDHLLE